MYAVQVIVIYHKELRAICRLMPSSLWHETTLHMNKTNNKKEVATSVYPWRRVQLYGTNMCTTKAFL